MVLHVRNDITSLSHPLIKRLVRLRERRARDAEGVALVEGAREVRRALAAGWEPTLLLSCAALQGPNAIDVAAIADWHAAAPHACEWRGCARAPFEKASLREHPDGVLGLFRPPTRSLADLPWPSDGLYLVADGLEKPGNLGALLRSADAAGADAVFVSGEGTDLLNPNVIRASMGSIFARPTLAVAAGSLRAALRAHGVRLVATSPHAERDLWTSNLRGSVAIVLGREHAGLAPEWLAAADEHVRVPMAASAADSLNVATTGALLLYEARRQRRANL
jgi:TrmH family RNA methyltransferase